MQILIHDITNCRAYIRLTLSYGFEDACMRSRHLQSRVLIAHDPVNDAHWSSLIVELL